MTTQWPLNKLLCISFDESKWEDVRERLENIVNTSNTDSWFCYERIVSTQSRKQQRQHRRFTPKLQFATLSFYDMTATPPRQSLMASHLKSWREGDIIGEQYLCPMTNLVTAGLYKAEGYKTQWLHAVSKASSYPSTSFNIHLSCEFMLYFSVNPIQKNAPFVIFV